MAWQKKKKDEEKQHGRNYSFTKRAIKNREKRARRRGGGKGK